MEGPAGPGRGAAAPGRRQLRQRLLRRHPGHRRRPGRADPAGRQRAGEPARGQDRGAAVARGRGSRRPRPGGDDGLVAGRRRAARHPRRLVLHRRLEALRLPRARRGDGVRLLRPGGGHRHDVRPDRDLRAGLPVRRDRDRLLRLRDPGGQQPARHPDRHGRGQAHAGRRPRRQPHAALLRDPRRRRGRWRWSASPSPPRGGPCWRWPPDHRRCGRSPSCSATRPPDRPWCPC